MKNIITVVLLLFVAASVVYLVMGDSSTTPAVSGRADAARIDSDGNSVAAEDSTRDSASAVVPPAPMVVVYYFHGTMRCSTCLKMEQYAREAIAEAFAAELEAGRVRWQAVNYDESANEHFVKEYDLVASALVIVSPGVDEQLVSRNLERIWDLVGDEDAFKGYVVDEVATMLGSDS